MLETGTEGRIIFISGIKQDRMSPRGENILYVIYYWREAQRGE